jgi:RNA polymerase sporulation-specific sigma factor
MRTPLLLHLPDAELAARVQAGDHDALRALIERYRRFARAKGRSYFLVGGDADDVEQEALIGLYKAARDFRPGHLASFRAFAELCITRQIITAIKTAARLKHQPLNHYRSTSAVPGGDEGDDRPLDELLPAAVEPDPLEALLSQEWVGSVRGMMADRLSAFEIDVLRLYVEGTSYQEIGARLGRSAKSVDNALQRIKRKLEEHLDGEAEADANAEASELAVA